MTGRTRVLFVGEAVTAAHVIRPLGLAVALDNRRYEAVVACDHHYEAMVRREGIAYEPVPSIDRETFLARLDCGAALYTQSELQTYVKDDLHVISTVNPDVIVGDFRISMGLSAELCGVPYLALSNAHWCPNSPLPLPVPEHPLVDHLGLAMGGGVIKMMMPYFFKIQARAMNRLRRWYGLSRIEGRGAPEVYTRGTRTLYLDTPALYGPLAPGRREDYIGPILWTPDALLPEWWDRLPSDQPVVWLSAGSSGDAAMMDEVATILVNSGLTVMAATGDRSHGLPLAVHTASFIPGPAAAARADLVVCNGGSGMVYQALAQGKPVLGIPRNMDQFCVMEAVERQGVGRLMRKASITAETLTRTTAEMLTDPGCRESALQQQCAIATMNPAQHLEHVVDAVLAETRSARLEARRAGVAATSWRSGTMNMAATC